MEETARLHLEPMETIGGNAKNRIQMKDSRQARGIDAGVWRRQKDTGINKAEGKMKTRHKALWFHIQAKVHTHANKSRGVRNKGCHSNPREPCCATGCSTHGHTSKALHTQTHIHAGMAVPPSPVESRPLQHTLISLSLFFPPSLKMQASSTQSLPCFPTATPERQRNPTWTQNPYSHILVYTF